MDAETENVGKMPHHASISRQTIQTQHKMNELVMRRSSRSGEGDVCGLGTRQN